MVTEGLQGVGWAAQKPSLAQHQGGLRVGLARAAPSLGAGARGRGGEMETARFMLRAQEWREEGDSQGQRQRRPNPE